MSPTASSLIRSLASSLLRAERRLEELYAALDHAPICAPDTNRKALEAAFRRKQQG
jgi:hypothetical protein